MKHIYPFAVIIIFILTLSNTAYSQNIGINTDGSAPNANAMLDIKSTNKGLLIPRITTANRIAIPNTKGLLVYDTDTNSFWYNDGTTWNEIGTGTTGWSLKGNSGTDTSINFIGTTDAKPLAIKVKDSLAGIIEYETPFNTSWGYQSLSSNTSGYANTSIGFKSLYKNTDGYDNTATGFYALHYNTTGHDNTANGVYALSGNTTGYYNTANGGFALSANTIGFNNTANGYQALYSNTTGIGNTANGAYALLNNITGNSNTANGQDALYYNSTGTSNAAIGLQALYYNTTGSGNNAIGYRSLTSNTTGDKNTAIGNYSLTSNTTSSGLTAIGAYSLFYNTTGTQNTAAGDSSLYFTTTGSVNTAMGNYSLMNNTSGALNTAMGVNGLYANTTGHDNVAVGVNSLVSNTTGIECTAVGSGALYGNTGSNNTAVGYLADMLIPSVTNSTAIGSYASVPTSNSVRIGNSAVTSIGGVVGWTNFSDGRYKQNIQQNVPGLLFINQLKPITYTLNVNAIEAKENAIKQNLKGVDGKLLRTTVDDPVMKQAIQEQSKIVYTGFVAQDVEKVAQSINYDFNGVDKPKDANTSFYGLRYADFVVPLVKAVQELSAENDSLKEKMTEMENIVSALNKKVEALVSTQNQINTVAKK